MKIDRLSLKNFMLFDKFDAHWSENINIICGSNNMGKSILLKVMYSLLAAYRASDASESKDKVESRFVDKLVNVFRSDDLLVGRLARRKQGTTRAECNLEFDNETSVKVSFSNKAENHIDLSISNFEAELDLQRTVVYFPPKEIISSTENFRALYEDMHIAFEETYNDLAKLLARPLKKGPNTEEQNQVLDSLGKIMEGTIVQRNNKFYLNVSGKGEFEMGLVSEGYRKLATIVYLIRNGALNANSVLFWDEPETNMNPKMIRPLVEAIVTLAKLGVQVFIATHDYFFLQYMNMYMVYPEINKDQINIMFLSLYADDEKLIAYETASDIDDFKHNAIAEEFDAIYDREQGIIYDRMRK